MLHLIRIVAILLLILGITTQSASACTIESGATPILAAYLRSVAQEVGDIRSFASTNNSCNGAQGTFSNENRFLSLINSIDARVPIGRNILADFEYKAMLIARGEARSPVMRQGVIIRNIETNTITPAIKVVSSACALDAIMTDGRTTKEALTMILMRHRALDSYYKEVALGNTRQPAGLESDMQALYDEIRDNYSPHATASCKGEAEVGNLEDIMRKIQDRLDKKAAKTENSQNTWNEALDLFAGRGTDTLKYQNLQKRLLSAELTRQGLTKNARDAMLGNLTCFQQNTTPTSTNEEMAKARVLCLDSVVSGLEKLTNPFQNTILKATNTEDYIRRLLAHDKATTRLQTDMAIFWQKLEKTKNTDEKLNEKMTTDLVNMHGNITLTNELLKVKIVEMYDNCMKAQRDIPCPQPE